MSTLHCASKQAMRFKSAAFGLGITLAPIAVLAFAQVLLAPHTVVAVGRMDPEIDTWAVSAFRSDLLEGYSVVASILAAYWLLTTTPGRGRFLEIKKRQYSLGALGPHICYCDGNRVVCSGAGSLQGSLSGPQPPRHIDFAALFLAGCNDSGELPPKVFELKSRRYLSDIRECILSSQGEGLFPGICQIEGGQRWGSE